MSVVLKDLLRYMVDNDASDIYLTEGITPMFRIEGSVQPYGEAVLTAAETADVANQIMNERQRKIFTEEHEIEPGPPLPGAGPVQGECLRPARMRRPRPETDQDTDKDHRRFGPAADPQGHSHDQARPRSGGGGHGQRKVNDPRRDDRLQERASAGAHHYRGGPHRVHPSPTRRAW